MIVTLYVVVGSLLYCSLLLKSERDQFFILLLGWLIYIVFWPLAMIIMLFQWIYGINYADDDGQDA